MPDNDQKLDLMDNRTDHRSWTVSSIAKAIRLVFITKFSGFGPL